MATVEPVDHERLRQLYEELGHDAEILREIIDTFVADVEASSRALNAAVLEADFAGQRLIAHGLKGSAAAVGAVRLQQAAAALERAVAEAEKGGATLQGGLEAETMSAMAEAPAAIRAALERVTG